MTITTAHSDNSVWVLALSMMMETQWTKSPILRLFWLYLAFIRGNLSPDCNKFGDSMLNQESHTLPIGQVSLRPFNGSRGLLRVAGVMTLFVAGATPIIALFYTLYAHLPAYLSMLWRATLGISFAIAAIGLGTAWLLLLTFDLLLNKH